MVEKANIARQMATMNPPISPRPAVNAAWVIGAPVTQNIGDGTYYHSGVLAIRAAIAAGTNITYKLLYNDAVAMTGGQPVEGSPTVPQFSPVRPAKAHAVRITRQRSELL